MKEFNVKYHSDNNEFSKSNKKVGIVALIVAVVCFGIAFNMIKEG